MIKKPNLTTYLAAVTFSTVSLICETTPASAIGLRHCLLLGGEVAVTAANPNCTSGVICTFTVSVPPTDPTNDFEFTTWNECVDSLLIVRPPGQLLDFLKKYDLNKPRLIPRPYIVSPTK